MMTRSSCTQYFAAKIMSFSIIFVSVTAYAETVAGPYGGGGGGEFRSSCEPGEFVVGFDVQNSHVTEGIAPVCGRGHGTYGRPWAGGPIGNLKKLRCPGSGKVTTLDVFVDNGPLVANVGFSCWNPVNGSTDDKVFKTRGQVVNHKLMRCAAGEVAIGIFGRAGTAIDSLGLICDTFE